MQGQAHRGLSMDSVYSGPDALQGLRPITPELMQELNDKLEQRRKEREANDPQPAPSAEPAPITGIRRLRRRPGATCRRRWVRPRRSATTAT